MIDTYIMFMDSKGKIQWGPLSDCEIHLGSRKYDAIEKFQKILTHQLSGHVSVKALEYTGSHEYGSKTLESKQINSYLGRINMAGILSAYASDWITPLPKI